MFIELTDLLRCPAPHDEQFLVLIPDAMVGRSVRSGRLGCPVCHREYLIQQGVAVFAPAPDQDPMPDPGVAPDALTAFLGLSGPGGYAAVVGGNSELALRLVESIPAVHFVAINPSPDSTEAPMVSLLRAGSIPLKARSLRGVILLKPFASERGWRDEAARVLLPGLRVVGQGEPPVQAGLEVLASAGGWWVAQKD